MGVRPGSPYEVELAPVKQAALAGRAGRGVAVDTKVLGESRVRQTAYFRNLARPLGGRHSLMGYFVLRGQVIGGMMLGRTGGPFRDEDVAHVADLLPALALGRASYGQPGLARVPLQPKRSQGRWPWGERVLARRVMGEIEVRVRDERGYREMVARDLCSVAQPNGESRCRSRRRTRCLISTPTGTASNPKPRTHSTKLGGTQSRTS